MNMLSWIPVIIIGLIGIIIFYIAPQIRKFRTTLGIDKQIASGQLSWWQSFKLKSLGMKTPLLTGLSTIFAFMTAESDQFQKFGFEQFLSKEHAAMVTAVFVILGWWSHFSGLQQAAAAEPMVPPVPLIPAGEMK